MNTVDNPTCMAALGVQAIAILGRILAICLLCIAPNAFADSAPEEVGKFTRNDGVVVTAVKQQIDSLFYFTGVSCWFSLPDGTNISVPNPAVASTLPLGERERSCVIRASDSSAEIYRYKTDVLPVASRVLKFDGYTFTDVTKPGKRWLSPLVHTRDHLGEYLVVIALFTLLAILHLIWKWFVKLKPERGWWLVVRVVWFFCYALTTLICVFLLLFVVTGWASSTSPLLFLIFFAVGFMPYRRLFKYVQSKRLKQGGVIHV